MDRSPRQHRYWLAAIAAALSIGSAARAQCPPPAWVQMNQMPGIGGTGYCSTTWDPDGPGPAPSVLVVGGLIWGASGAAGGTAVDGVAVWDGSTWYSLASIIGVRVLHVWNGQLIAGGTFSGFGGNVARWTPSGWQLIGGGMNGYVWALATYNGELVAGGDFTTAGGVAASGVARWNGTTWQPLGAGVPCTPFGSTGIGALAVYNGELVAGGAFATAGGVPASNIARWNGTTWQAVGGGVAPVASSLAVYNGELVASGVATVGGSAIPFNGIARWNGTVWQPLGSGVTSGAGIGYVNTLAVDGGMLFAGGTFTQAGAVAAPNVARWDGTTWQALGSGITNPPSSAVVLSLTSFGGEVIATGTFESAGGGVAKNIARWNGAAWLPLGTGLNREVLALTTWNGALAAGGRFTIPGGSPPTCDVALWNGTTWQPLGSGMNDYVSSLVVHNAELYAGGAFTIAGGVAANSIARWTGSAWVPLGVGMDARVYALAVYNGELIAGGDFLNAGGAPANRIARWNGTAWLPLSSGMDGLVLSFSVYNGSLIAGGTFSTAGGVAANNIARWDGTSWQALGSGMTGILWPSVNQVNSLAVANGELVAGGRFTTAGGVAANNVARWNGATWAPMASGGYGITALTVHNGQIVATNITISATSTWLTVAAWNGSVWQGLTPLGVGGANALTSFQGSLVAGGNFIGVPGTLASPYVIRWGPASPLLALAQPSGPGTGLQVTNRWLLPGHEYYNLASLDLAPGGPGSGPYGGLWFSNVASLLQQVLQPLGAAPTHFIAPAAEVSFGPYALPAGLSFEAISVDVTGGVVGCLTPVMSFTVQ